MIFFLDQEKLVYTLQGLERLRKSNRLQIKGKYFHRYFADDFPIKNLVMFGMIQPKLASKTRAKCLCRANSDFGHTKVYFDDN